MVMVLISDIAFGLSASSGGMPCAWRGYVAHRICRAAAAHHQVGGAYERCHRAAFLFFFERLQARVFRRLGCLPP